MKLKDLLALMSSGETVTVVEVFDDGNSKLNTFRANNAPMRFWDRTIKQIWNGAELYGLCIRVKQD